jgi:hypothetical protein
MAEMAGPAEPSGKKTGKESKWKGSQSMFLIFSSSWKDDY